MPVIQCGRCGLAMETEFLRKNRPDIKTCKCLKTPFECEDHSHKVTESETK